MKLLLLITLLKLILSQHTNKQSIIVYSRDYLYSMYTKDNKIKHVFEAMDIDYNNHLSYNELEFYQRLTDPQLPLTMNDYYAVCKMTRANVKYGLDYYQFSNTYYELSDLLGTNITKDFNIIIRLQSSKSY